MKNIERYRNYGVENGAQRSALRLLGNTGIATLSDLTYSFGHDNIKFLRKEKFVRDFRVYTCRKFSTVLRLTQKGRKYVRKHLISKSLYKWRKSQALHDIKLSQFYMKLSKKERDSWINGERFRLTYKSRLLEDQGIIFDGYYTNSKGEIIPVEIITDTYSDKKITKMLTVLEHNYPSYHFIYGGENEI